MTPGLASATQQRPAHFLLGQCPLPVTFQMVANSKGLCEPLVLSLQCQVGEAIILSVGTPQPNPPGSVRVGEAVFASVWTLQAIPPGGLMVPDAALPLYRLHIHTLVGPAGATRPHCHTLLFTCFMQMHFCLPIECTARAEAGSGLHP